jgi:nitroimidazol reductase NimA-like FMN-containing flavoprotein (pyridoxamine 5'-phosphate oxidase superfamily)
MDEQLKTLVKKVLDDAFLMHLGISDGNGPWVASLIFVTDDDFNLYWMSMPNARHSQALASGGKAACSIVAAQDTHKERALQIEGLVSETSPTLAQEIKLLTKRGMPTPGQIGETLKNGHKWYKLAPSKIEVIDTELFEYERKSYL